MCTIHANIWLKFYSSKGDIAKHPIIMRHQTLIWKQCSMVAAVSYKIILLGQLQIQCFYLYSKQTCTKTVVSVSTKWGGEGEKLLPCPCMCTPPYPKQHQHSPGMQRNTNRWSIYHINTTYKSAYQEVAAEELQHHMHIAVLLVYHRHLQDNMKR